MPDLITYKGREYYVTKKQVFVVFYQHFKGYDFTTRSVLPQMYNKRIVRRLRAGKLRNAVRREAIRKMIARKEQ